MIRICPLAPCALMCSHSPHVIHCGDKDWVNTHYRFALFPLESMIICQIKFKPI